MGHDGRTLNRSVSPESRMQITTSNIILYCRDWQACLAFYQTQLRLPVTAERGWFVEFRLNEHSRLSIADEAATALRSSGGQGVTVTLEVDDIESTHRFLSAAGLQPPPIREHPWGARVIHIYDPEGHRLEFWAPLRPFSEPAAGS